jgi:hypothetical protein
MKNKGLSLLLLLLGGAAVYYYYNKKRYKGSVIVDPLGPGEFVPDVTNTVQEVVSQLNSADKVNISIVDQIKEMQKPSPVITYQKFYKPDLQLNEPEQSYQTFYATINGKKMGVPHTI